MKSLGTSIAFMIISTAALATPVVESDLGDIASGQSTGIASGDHDELWFSFDVGTFSFLTIDTVGSSFDTELGLYDSAGNLIDSNDDNVDSGGLCGIYFYCSLLTFGTGDLEKGTYYLALGSWPTSWGTGEFDVSSNYFSGFYSINFETDNHASAGFETFERITAVPEPGTLALLGLGLLGMAARLNKTV